MSDTVPRGHEQTLQLYEKLWREERAAAALYRGLAKLADPPRAEMLAGLAVTEERHAAHWEGKLRAAGRTPLAVRPSLRQRLMLWRARHFGLDRALGAAVRAEASARDRYRDMDTAPPGMAAEELAHGRALAMAATPNVGDALAMADARHRTTAGGVLRAAVFGVNDGLVSNLALIMGVAGGTADPAVILLAGVAGLVAGAGSMAAGEWISVRSQRELYEREIAVERQELEEFPEDERAELALIYRGKGLDQASADEIADRLMADPDVALDSLVREELGLNPADLGSPWRAAASSFVAFAAGALIPLGPYVVATGATALAAASLLSAVALALVGAGLSRLTGRSAWRSALRMVLIGGGAAVVTFLIGSLVGVTLD